MFAFIAGAAAVLGLLALRRAVRFRAWRGAHGRSHLHRRHGGRGRWLHHLFDRLDATPAQEKELAQAVDELLSTLHRARTGLDDARAGLAQAMRNETLGTDDATQATAPLAARFDDLRNAASDALRRIHGVLDEKQRAELARLLERGPRHAHAHAH